MKLSKKVTKLLKIAPLLTLREVGFFVKSHPVSVRDSLCEAMNRTHLTDNQYEGLAFIAIMTGGRAFSKLPAMIKANKEQRHLLDNIKIPLECCNFSSNSVDWLMKNCELATT